MGLEVPFVVVIAISEVNKMEKIITVCYRQRQEWNSRKEAEMYFLEGMMNSDGSERERYTAIYLKLLAGDAICTDNEEGEMI